MLIVEFPIFYFTCMDVFIGDYLKETMNTTNGIVSRLKVGLEQATEDHAACGQRQAESLQFTQQLTERTLKGQAENEQLKAQLTLIKEDLDSLKQQNSQHERDLADVSERLRITSNERKCLEIRLSDTEKERDANQRRLRELQHEKAQLRRKAEQNTKQLGKELQLARKHIDELMLSSSTPSSSSSSVNPHNNNSTTTTMQPQQQQQSGTATKVNGIISEGGGRGVLQLDQKVLVDRIVQLQKNLARKTEKIEFLEEHSRELMAQLNRKKAR